MLDQAKPLLKIEDMSISFSSPDEPDIEAVRQVDLTLTPGKTLALVGESGCGKSVTARAILRLLDKNAKIGTGRILFAEPGGAPVDLAALKPDSPAMRSVRGNHIAMIFQEPMTSLNPVMTVGNQIAEALLLHEGLNQRDALEPGDHFAPRRARIHAQMGA